MENQTREVSMFEVQVQIVDGNACVTSMQVAEVFGKRHDNVVRDIRNVIEKCSPSFIALNFEVSSYSKDLGDGIEREYPMYLLSKDALMMVTMGYTTPKAMEIKEAYIAKFNEMEKTIRDRQLAVPNFSNPAEAARAWADAYEAKLLAQKTAELAQQTAAAAIEERDHAVRTKAWIGDRKTATAMATASHLSRENGKLKDQLGDGRHYKQAKNIHWALDVFVNSKSMWSQLGKRLSEISRDMGYEMKVCQQSDHDVKAYHVDVIEELKRRLDEHPDMMQKYRLHACQV